MNGDKDLRRKDFDANGIKKVFEDLAKLVVETPENVNMRVHESEDNVIFDLCVDANDYGKVVGKSGKMAGALRIVMRAIAGNFDKRLVLEFSFSGKRNRD